MTLTLTMTLAITGPWRLKELNRSGRTRFISAEGCYSHAAANMKVRRPATSMATVCR